MSLALDYSCQHFGKPGPRQYQCKMENLWEIVHCLQIFLSRVSSPLHGWLLGAGRVWFAWESGELCDPAGLAVHPAQPSVASAFPPKLNLPPHAPLADKDGKDEEASEDVDGLGKLVDDKEGCVLLQLKTSMEQTCYTLQCEIKPNLIIILKLKNKKIWHPLRISAGMTWTASMIQGMPRRKKSLV